MISPELQTELRSRYNPDGSNLRSMQLRMLEMLVYLDGFCRENNIRFWLSSGTCLGAVRHGGFIPWDDDVDVEMLKPDYDRFLMLFKETDDWVLQTQKNDRFYASPYAKMRDKHSVVNECDGSDQNYLYHGVFIDVFCMEEISDRSAHLSLKTRWYLSNWAKKRLPLYKRILFISIKWILYSILIPLCRFFDRYSKAKRLQYTYATGFIWEQRCIDDIIPLGFVEFEGFNLPVPGHFNRYLSKLYGDYLSIPNDDGITPHCCYYSLKSLT